MFVRFVKTRKMSRSEVPEKCFIFVDVEATGPSLLYNFMPCFGMAVVAFFNDEEPRLLRSKKWYMQPPATVPPRAWDTKTLQEFWLLPNNRHLYHTIVDKLAVGGGALPANEAMADFVRECHACLNGGATQCTLFADTSGFDFAWLHLYLSCFGPMNCVSPDHLFGSYKPVRDVTSYFCGFALALPENDAEARYPHKAAMRRLGLSDADWFDFMRRHRIPAYDHDPEHDAAHVGMRSSWILWSVSRLRDERWRMVLVVRTDLRMKHGRIASHSSHAAVGAYSRASSDVLRKWHNSGQSKRVVKCPDSQTLFRVRDSARKASVNHFLQCGDKNKVPCVLALGPARSEDLAQILGSLKMD